MTPEEVRMLDNRYALLFIRGERPVKDLKFNILKHPFVKDTADGDAKLYLHGQERDAVAAIELFYGEPRGRDDGRNRADGVRDPFRRGTAETL